MCKRGPIWGYAGIQVGTVPLGIRINCVLPLQAYFLRVEHFRTHVGRLEPMGKGQAYCIPYTRRLAPSPKI